MDEPLSNLDAQLRAEMRQEIRALQRKLGITMVYVTHDQVEAMSMADRVVLLNGGKIEQNGTPVELYESPANTFVARFIGTPPMNLMKLDAGEGAVIAGTDGPAVLPGELGAGMLGVRPEHIGSCTSAACARRSRASSIWAATRWSRAASAASASPCARWAASGCRAAIPRGSTGRVGATLFRRRRRARRRPRPTLARNDVRVTSHDFQGGRLPC